MKTLITPEDLGRIQTPLQTSLKSFARSFPGATGHRQPVHTLYGGAHLFKSDLAQKLGKSALATVASYAPNFSAFARALQLRGSDQLPSSLEEAQKLEELFEKDPDGAPLIHPAAGFARRVYGRVLEKLQMEPVEDFRIDFEDGFGHRPDEEEDECALAAADQVVKGIQDKTLPRFLGIRVKSFSQELFHRGARTIDLFLGRVLESAGRLPDNFVTTLPKVVAPEQVTALVSLFELIESKTNLEPGSLKLEIMVETTQSLVSADGRMTLPLLVAAAKGRCVAAHFGVYDYTACCSITAEYQWMHHASCDHARHLMQVSLSDTGIWLSDGATNVMPVGPYREKDGPLTPEKISENRVVIHRAWKTHFDHVSHSLAHGYYQGWDLHPAQLPTRYAALYAFFLESLPAASKRLGNFIAMAAQATLVGDVFDDAATGQGLLNFFLRGLNCGAIQEEEARATGLTREELETRSFLKILEGRRGSTLHEKP